MKKALAIILSVMMLMSTLVACGSKTDDSGDANNDAAASYPTKNVNVIVPFSAGGNTDMSMRALLNVATSLDSKYTFVVESVAYANGPRSRTKWSSSLQYWKDWQRDTEQEKDYGELKS